MGFYLNSDCNYSRWRDFIKKVYHYTFRFLFVLSNSTKYLTQTSEQAVYWKHLQVSELPEIEPSQTLNWSHFGEKKAFWPLVRGFFVTVDTTLHDLYNISKFILSLISIHFLYILFFIPYDIYGNRVFLVILFAISDTKTCYSAIFNLSKKLQAKFILIPF